MHKTCLQTLDYTGGLLVIKGEWISYKKFLIVLVAAKKMIASSLHMF
jgi:hypothetical protein